MNKPVIHFHLREALEQLQSTLSELEGDEYGWEALQVDLSHAYHHLNTAWNGRDCTTEEFAECSAELFEAWSKMPSYKEFMLE
jgi:hypothetical protein